MYKKNWPSSGVRCALLGLALAASAAHAAAQPADWDAGIASPTARNLSHSPHVVEVNIDASVTQLEVRPGLTSPVWTYNGTVPGPVIRAQVGDTLVVHFTNHLPEPTTIHWHGINVPYEMDGVPDMPLPAVAPGGQFTYRFTLDTAGTYWYHPHVNSSAQVGWGLYGALIVDEPQVPKAFGDDLVLVLSDIDIDKDGHLNAANVMGPFGDLWGREGNTLLVNGKLLPHVKARAGQPQRWRIINASRARYFSFAMPAGSSVRIGTGNRLTERPEKIRRVTLAPAERIELVFTSQAEPGTTAMVRWTPVARGYGVEAGDSMDIIAIDTVAEEKVASEPLPEHLQDIVPIDTSGAVERSLELTIGGDRRSVWMGINGVRYEDQKPIHVALGEKDVWTIVNNTVFDHPFHLHGFAFQVLDEPNPTWRDTVNVPRKSRVRIAINFNERPGMWMFHCHILDHAEVGMMGMVHLE
jgi:FtsP/CotA-like multicopper oxidase with cupredoxin domain